MKNSRPAKPTRSQKESIKKAGFSWENWLMVSEDTFMLTIVNKTSGIKKRKKNSSQLELRAKAEADIQIPCIKYIADGRKMQEKLGAEAP